MKINLIKLILLPMATLLGLAAYSQENMEIEGAIIISNSEDPTPAPGTIRWTGTDFEGWNGQWMSLTSSSGPIGSGSVSDIDGNQYLTVVIGTQIWMRENLRTAHYNDGTSIPEKKLNSDWDNTSPAWCWYENNHANDQPYGKLYNWYASDAASNGGKNVCPMDWHVPTDSEWSTLTTFLGGVDTAGGKMKEVGTTHWDAPNTGATNESGFTGIPGGYRRANGSFREFGFLGVWWSSTKSSMETDPSAWDRFLFDTSVVVNRSLDDKRLGFSIRCVSD